MDTNIYYSRARAKIKELFLLEHIPLSRGFLANFLKFISKICVYEEEENKIRPRLIIGTNIIDSAIKQVPRHYWLQTRKGAKNGTDIDFALKCLVPFCNNGWIAYIDLKPDCLCYGLLRAFTGPQGLSATELLFQQNPSEYSLIDYNLVEISVLSNFEMKFEGLRRNVLSVDFRFLNYGSSQQDRHFLNMAEDIISNIESADDKAILRKIFLNVLSLIPHRVHGTIVVVVKSDYGNVKNLLADGIWLDKPIDLANKELEADLTDALSNELFYGLAGLLIGMMNIDGMTIIDNKGKIIAYHVFLSQNDGETQVSGGARRRAALSLIKEEHTDIIGVYFLSQDGFSFYERNVKNG